MVGAKKAASSVKKCHVPAIGAMARTSSEESQESSPRGQVVQTSAPEFLSRSEPRGQSQPALVQRPYPEASLQIGAPFSAGGVSTSC
jgi:hypothetical protein